MEENAASNGICLGQPLVLRDDNAEEVIVMMIRMMMIMITLAKLLYYAMAMLGR